MPLWSLDVLSNGNPSSLMDESSWDVIRDNFLATYNGNRRPLGLFCTCIAAVRAAGEGGGQAPVQGHSGA